MKVNKKSFLFLLILLYALPDNSHAQGKYGNEWIDYSKTYWKFKVNKEGIFRIQKAALDAAGIPSATLGDNFILYRDGKEVALYTSTNNLLSATDYLEFRGTTNDGYLDKELYLDSTKQADEKKSLFSDTAAYFLTYDNNTNHLRYKAITTPIPSPTPTPAVYCWETLTYHGTAFFLGGKNTDVITHLEEFYSSQFDRGEGFVDNTGFTKNFSTPNFVSGSMNATFKLTNMGYSRYDSTHYIKISFNGNLVSDTSYGGADLKKTSVKIPATSLLTNNTFNCNYYKTGPYPDWYGFSFWELEYPRNFNVSGLDYFLFKMNASATQQYVELSNFNHGGISPKLYDLTNNKWYTGDISVSGKTRFYIDASLTDAQFVLYATGSTSINNITAVKQINFTNYNTLSNQGNYIIITHKNLMKNTGGHNYIQEYKDYRSSATGGGYNVVVVDIEELYDQYAYGVYLHPSSIRHFLSYAYDQWGSKPQYAFLIGKGILYNEYYTDYASYGTAAFEGLVPTYGHPGSDIDFVTDRNTWKMNMAISRLSAWNSTEVGDYLNKVKQYEAALVTAALPTPGTELWKKQVLHVAGGDLGVPGFQASTLLPTLGSCATIIKGPYTGGIVTTIAKSTTGLPSTVDDKTIDSLITNGVAMVTYYGHGSATSLDYNLKNPSEYNSLPKIPFFSAFGCNISDIFELKSTLKTISEGWVSAPNSGAISSLASDNDGYTNFLSPKYLPYLYYFIANKNYGKTIGSIYKSINDSIANGLAPRQSSFELTHLECFILQGDPAVHLPQNSSKPDYYVGDAYVSTNPVNITTATDSFQMRIVAFNLGMATTDTVQVKVEHTNPAGVTTVSKTYNIVKLSNTDTTSFNLPINKISDLGLNTYKITIDPNNKYDELSESNNIAYIKPFVSSDNIIPVYPENFAIVYQPDLTLKASTLNVFKTLARYRIEIDTTELFNSPSKLQTTINSVGGVIKWKPPVTLQDSTVYYWRTAVDTLVSGSYIWANSSFIYLKYGSTGWNQSHYYQYMHNSFDSLQYNTSRHFKYGTGSVALEVINRVMELPPPYNFVTAESANNRVYRNGADLQRFECAPYNTIQIIVLDTIAGQPWRNPVGGAHGALAPCATTRDEFCFSFPIGTSEGRNNARVFLDSIPNGYYILVKNCIYAPWWSNWYVDTWKSDTLSYGSGKSLYHSMRNLGFNQIDSFYREIPFAMICKKGFTDYPIQQYYGSTPDYNFDTTFYIPITGQDGKMNSVVVGPASQWQRLKWRTSSFYDTLSRADSSLVSITGIDNANNQVLLYQGISRDTAIGFINATTYPRLKLQWYNTDTIYHTAPQLDYWRILYTPVPEAALNPSAYYTFTDSVSVGQLMNMETAIETLNNLPMDSMLVRFKVVDANNVYHLLADKKYRKLAGNDTLHASISFDPKPYPGNNYLFVEANPDNNQPEEYHPNNLGYVPFNIKTDVYNPVLDVTFDGIHILDKDIVSSTPLIKVLLRDENKYLALKDTTSMQLYIRFPKDPDNSRRRIPYDGTICKFIPADLSIGKNEAYIEYRPTFTQDSIYQLYVTGQDETGNGSGGGNQYSVSFDIVTKSSITNILNYPNPFSTSTAFVFTLTGNQIPSQFKIQIISVTGKVVREITKQELGPLHIGRNITEYKWDGRDQYGQLLGNGVYLYRVVTAINGNSIDHRDNSAVDQFYKNGYSKMYIMR